MYVMDASAMIHAWDNYPVEIEGFSSVWDSMQNLMEQEVIVFAKANYQEIQYNSKDCYDWLKDVGPTVAAPSNSIIKAILQIKTLLGIEGDSYHAKGVDEGDLFAIATAKVYGYTLVNNEALQPGEQQNKKKYKIPKVCQLPQVGVESISVLDLIKSPEFQGH